MTEQTRTPLGDPTPEPAGPSGFGDPSGFGAPGSGAPGPGASGPGAPGGLEPARPAGTTLSSRRGVALLAAVALAAGLIGGGTGAGLTAALDEDQASSPTTSLDRPVSPARDTAAPQGSVEQVAAAVLPSVVSLEVAGPGGRGEGSGVIISDDGLILTNNHVVDMAASGGSIQVSFNDGSTASARIVGRDPVTDLAVVKAEGVSGLTEATLGSSASLDPGEQVVAIGSPLGLQGTVTSGIVSALNRPVRTGNAGSVEAVSTVIDAIQTDAAINPGNSGGPLVNMHGEVVGINTAIATLGGSIGGQSGSIGLGFAIPIDQARWIAEQLIEDGAATHAQLGVSVQDAQDGAGIVEVTPGSAAEEAGLQPGDVVTRVGDREIDDADSLIAAIRSHQPGERVTVTYLRGSDEHTAEVTLGSDA